MSNILNIIKKQRSEIISIKEILKQLHERIQYLEKFHPAELPKEKIYGILTIDQHTGMQVENEFSDRKQFQNFFIKHVWQKEAFKATQKAWDAINEILTIKGE